MVASALAEQAVVAGGADEGVVAVAAREEVVAGLPGDVVVAAAPPRWTCSTSVPPQGRHRLRRHSSLPAGRGSTPPGGGRAGGPGEALVEAEDLGVKVGATPPLPQRLAGD